MKKITAYNLQNAITLMYHDVVEAKNETSGFLSPDAALYKLGKSEFNDHLKALNCVGPTGPHTIFDLPTEPQKALPWMITFDDGGLSAYTCIADRLEACGWRGHFFIATDFIGTRSFINASQIRKLHQRGHVIGAHSCSHPLRMASCSREQILHEWKTSIETLSEILGFQITIASVPGGQYEKKIAEAASQAGIKVLFTSEPTAKCHLVDGCQVYGRYSIQRFTSPRTAAAFAAGQLVPRIKQMLLWKIKKVAKTLGGLYYLKARAFLLERKFGL